jgi:CheY-like chemotaxis protein
VTGRFFRSLEETILLVDDDAALLEVTSIVLASEGYRVLTAEDGVEALWISSSWTSCCHG